MRHRKRVTPLVWCISNADSEQVERRTGRVVNIANQSKLLKNNYSTHSRIHKTNNIDLGSSLMKGCKKNILNLLLNLIC